MISFNNTEVAFKHKTNAGLRKARMLFKSFNLKSLLVVGPSMAKLAVWVGLKSIIKNTIFEQFCGGERAEDCTQTIANLAKNNIGTILDYSVEGEEKETVFDQTCNEILKTIDIAKNNLNVAFSVFKVTGIARFALLEKVNNKQQLSDDEIAEYAIVKKRFESICKSAFENNIRLFVDAEETWIQNAIDTLTEDMMAKYNTEKAIIYNTVQLYRHDRLQYVKDLTQKANYFIGLKLVRGAYMEKERARAEEMGYASPIQPNKEACDRDYNLALEWCVDHSDKISICAGTHNEESSLLLTQLIEKKQLNKSNKQFYFSQLLGMSDHISYNLAANGYNVAKYVPYGPVLAVIPYLTRRAQENSSLGGQVGRELDLIEKELKRRG